MRTIQINIEKADAVGAASGFGVAGGVGEV
jgi:hypothetical protein